MAQTAHKRRTFPVRSTRSARKWLRASLAAVLASLLFTVAGCQAVPRSGEVTAGLENLQQADPTVLFDPASPLPDANPEEIARGFLAAAASATDDYAIAREYLTPEYQQQWAPSTGVLIDEGSRPFKATEDTVGIITVNTVAQVDPRGFLRPSASGLDSVDLRFEFEQVDGQWRISSAPAGIVLDQSTFTAVWDQYALAFISDTGEIVREPRWFINDAALLTNTVRQLLEGPSPQLAVGARSGFRADMELEGSVTVAGGEARIQLRDNLDAPSRAELDLMQQQLAYTMGEFDNLTSFRLVTTSHTLLNGPVIPTDTAQVAKPSYVLTADSFAELAGSELGKRHPLSDTVVALKPQTVALQDGGELLAALTTEGAYAVSSQGAQLVDSRSGVLAPSIDRWGFVWTAAPTSSSEVYVTGAGGTQQLFQLPAVESHGLRQIRISPDGTRMALLVQTNKDTQVFIAGIDRDPSGAPTHLNPTTTLAMHVTGESLDFDWIDGTRMALLVTAGASSRVVLGGPGSFNGERGTLPLATQISGAERASSVRVLSAENRVYRPQGGTHWESLLNNVLLLAKWS